MNGKGVIAAVLVVAALVAAGCGRVGVDGQSSAARAKPRAVPVTAQLRYLDPRSDLVASIDLRYRGSNGVLLRRLATRALTQYRARHPKDRGVPREAGRALARLARLEGVNPRNAIAALNGHLVIGTKVIPARRGRQRRNEAGSSFEPRTTTVYVYRSRGGALRRILKRLAEHHRTRPVRGHPEARRIDDGTALVNGHTLVAVDAINERRALRAALNRGRRGTGVPERALSQAVLHSGQPDPFIVASGNLDLAKLLVPSDALARARRAVPLLGAIRGGTAALTLSGTAIDGNIHIDTGGKPLSASDLPIGPPGDVQVPNRPHAIVGGSRDQSVTTAFFTRVARSLFSGSQFDSAVDATERKLGISFEQEFLRQFNCPSVSVLSGAASQHFAARSCVADPARMRALLPRLAPELPAILRGVQKLPAEGLVSLLLVAPDAPLTPAFASKGAKPVVRLVAGGPGATEQLYQLRGLQDPDGEVGVIGQDRVVFGMEGNAFVVGTDLAGVRRVAHQPTRSATRQSASVTQVPIDVIADGDRDAESILGKLFGTVELSADAVPSGIDLRAHVPVKPR